MNRQEVIDKWAKDRRKKVSDDNKRLFCAGCRKDWYNHNKSTGCMHLKKAKLKKREIYMTIHSISPSEITTLTCFIPRYK